MITLQVGAFDLYISLTLPPTNAFQYPVFCVVVYNRNSAGCLFRGEKVGSWVYNSNILLFLPQNVFQYKVLVY